MFRLCSLMDSRLMGGMLTFRFDYLGLLLVRPICDGMKGVMVLLRALYVVDIGNYLCACVVVITGYTTESLVNFS